MQVPRTLGQRPQEGFHPVLPEGSEDPDTVAPPRGPSLLRHGLFLSGTASSRTFLWLCASPPHTWGSFPLPVSLWVVRSRPCSQMVAPGEGLRAPHSRPFAQAIRTGQAAPVVPVTRSTVHGHVWASSDGQEAGQGTAVQPRWWDRSCPGGARGAPLVLGVSPHSVGAALGVLMPVPSPIQPGARSQRAQEHPEAQKCKMMGK